jgi:hypothetical protein
LKNNQLNLTKRKSKLIIFLVLAAFILQASGLEHALACCPGHSGQDFGGGAVHELNHRNKTVSDSAKTSNETKCHDPVFLSSGEYNYSHQDLFIPGRGLSVDITRTYLSQKPYNNRFGYGWFFSFNIQLKRLANNNVVILAGDGHKDDLAKILFSGRHIFRPN